MKKPPRVLYIDYSVRFGGAVKSLGLTLRSLPVQAFIFTAQDADIIAKWFPNRDVFSFRRIINYRTAARVASRARKDPLRWLAVKGVAVADVAATSFNFVRLLLFMKRKRIDVVHLNNGFMPPEGLLAARAAHVPCVVHLRDFLQGNSVGSDAAYVSAVITVSDAVAASLNGSPIPGAARMTVHDPVDLELVARSGTARKRIRNSIGLTDDDVAVAIFGRVIAWKGQLEFVRALAPAMNADKHIRAVIVGDESDGDPAYFDRVRQAIAASPVSARFILAGYRENVEDYYAAVDIVVHSSITPEPFGMVVPEAMASGRAVIAMDAGGPREVIENGIDGLLVPVADVEAMSRAVLQLSSDKSLRDAMGMAAKEKASRFGIKEQAEKIATVYDSILSKPKAAV